MKFSRNPSTGVVEAYTDNGIFMGNISAMGDSGPEEKTAADGGPGSGNFGHKGRPGKRGGSAPRNGSQASGKPEESLATLRSKLNKVGRFGEAAEERRQIKAKIQEIEEESERAQKAEKEEKEARNMSALEKKKDKTPLDVLKLARLKKNAAERKWKELEDIDARIEDLDEKVKALRNDREYYLAKTVEKELEEVKEESKNVRHEAAGLQKEADNLETEFEGTKSGLMIEFDKIRKEAYEKKVVLDRLHDVTRRVTDKVDDLGEKIIKAEEDGKDTESLRKERHAALNRLRIAQITERKASDEYWELQDLEEELKKASLPEAAEKMDELDEEHNQKSKELHSVGRQIDHIQGSMDSVSYELARMIIEGRVIEEEKDRLTKEAKKLAEELKPLKELESEISEKMRDIRSEQDNISYKYGVYEIKQERNKNAEKREEREAAEQGLSVGDLHRKKAEEEFGLTDSFLDAGWMFPNGSLLDFGEETDAERTEDHREISRIFTGSSEGDSALMRKFRNEGNIRLWPEVPGINISTDSEPTEEQYAEIARMIEEMGDQEGQFCVNFSDHYGAMFGQLQYTTDPNYFDDTVQYTGETIDPEEVLSDIREYFRTGETTEEFGPGMFFGDAAMAKDGGPGSGNFGHAGRPGKVGGSAKASGGAMFRTGNKESGYTSFAKHKLFKGISSSARSAENSRDFIKMMSKAQKNAIIDQYFACGADNGDGRRHLRAYTDRIYEMLHGRKGSDIRQTNKIAEGRDLSEEWNPSTGGREPKGPTREIDTDIEEILHIQGFDGVPKIVSQAEFDRIVQEHPEMPILMRSFVAVNQSRLDEFNNDLEHGWFYVDCSEGGAGFGRGMYCAGIYSKDPNDKDRKEGIKLGKYEMDDYLRLGYKRVTENAPPPTPPEGKSRACAYNQEGDRNFWYYDPKDMVSGWAALPDHDGFIAIKGVAGYDANVYYVADGKIRSLDGQSVYSVGEMTRSEEWTYVEGRLPDEEVNPRGSTRMMTLDPSAKIITYNELQKIKNKSEVIRSEAREKARTMKEEVLSQVEFEDAWCESKLLDASLGQLEEELPTGSVEKIAAYRKAHPDRMKVLLDASENISKMLEKANIEAKKYDRFSYMDSGVLAAALGYDAINAEGHGRTKSYTVVLNRTKVILSEEEVHMGGG